MKQIQLGGTRQSVPALAVGCMRITGLSKQEADRFVMTCMDNGATFFDHADIYGNGACEELFGSVLAGHEGLRDKMFLQSKCGIVPQRMYDFSKEHLINSVEGSLRRLHTDRLDMLLLHRPDALMEPEVVAEVFDLLAQQGKVLHFGVSNMNPMQIMLLKKNVRQPLLVNQLQFSLPVSNMIASGMEVNMTSDGADMRDGSVLDYCRLNEITIQAWSPFQKPNWKGLFLGSKDYPELNAALEDIARLHNADSAMIAAAWILRHPAHMQVIAGTTNAGRIAELARASEIELSREEWYRLYLAAGHILP